MGLRSILRRYGFIARRRMLIEATRHQRDGHKNCEQNPTDHGKPWRTLKILAASYPNACLPSIFVHRVRVATCLSAQRMSSDNRAVIQSGISRTTSAENSRLGQAESEAPPTGDSRKWILVDAFDAPASLPDQIATRKRVPRLAIIEHIGKRRINQGAMMIMPGTSAATSGVNSQTGLIAPRPPA